MNTRESLIFQLKNNYDEDAWKEFNRFYLPYIKGICRRFLPNKSDQEDCSQIILISIWKSLPNFNYNRAKGKFRTWLMSVSRNKIYNFLDKEIRYKKRTETAQFPSKDDSFFQKEALTEWRNYIMNLAWENIKCSFNQRLHSSRA